MTEEKKEWTFHFKCTKCSFKFSINRDNSDMKKVDVKKMKCMLCGSPIQWDTINFPYAVKPSSESQSKMNIEATNIALKMAAEQKRLDAELGIDRMVQVTSNQEGRNYGKTEQIPEKVIGSIEEKIKPILTEIGE